jgi:NAD(P)-dependent dehydrogenase (short-subunit alcohol dehydrogenase family)
MRLEGKVALVTGATRGIGRAIAHRFAGEGARVVLTGRSADAGRAVEDEIRRAGGAAAFVPMDVGVEDDVRRAVDAAVARFGRLTTLVNNAAAVHLVGTPEKGDTQVTDMRNAVFDELLKTNVWGLMWAAKYAIPAMLAAGGGSIVNISSNAALRGQRNMDGYTATKGAMNALGRSLAVEYAKQRIRVNTISVGFVQSGEGTQAFADDPALRKYLESVIRTPYFGEPDDVAWGAVYLASDESRYVTGTTLTIDGGSMA